MYLFGLEYFTASNLPVVNHQRNTVTGPAGFSDKARRLLDWAPPYSVDEEPGDNARWFLGRKS